MFILKINTRKLFELWKYVKMYVCAYNITHGEGNGWNNKEKIAEALDDTICTSIAASLEHKAYNKKAWHINVDIFFKT